MEIIITGMAKGFYWKLCKGNNSRPIAVSAMAFSRRTSAKRAAQNFLRDMEGWRTEIEIKS